VRQHLLLKGSGYKTKVASSELEDVQKKEKKEARRMPASQPNGLAAAAFEFYQHMNISPFWRVRKEMTGHSLSCPLHCHLRAVANCEVSLAGRAGVRNHRQDSNEKVFTSPAAEAGICIIVQRLRIKSLSFTTNRGWTH